MFLFPVFLSGSIYNLSICSMIQNEAPWLEEWLEYHLLVGVEHFYLYDNESRDETNEVLAPYIERGLVEVIFWDSSEKHADPRGNVFDKYQITAFNDCVKRAKGASEFIAVLDVDEYLVPVKGKGSLWDLLHSKHHKSVGSFELHWLIYGTSHVWEIPKDKMMIEVLTKRAKDHHPWHHNTKCIHRVDAVEACWVHNASLKPGYRKLDLAFSDFRINHYWTRDQKSWLSKRQGLLLSSLKEFKESVPVEKYRHLMEVHEVEFNRMEDRLILKFVPALKKNLRIKNQEFQNTLLTPQFDLDRVRGPV